MFICWPLTKDVLQHPPLNNFHIAKSEVLTVAMKGYAVPTSLLGLTDPEDGAQHSPPKRRHIFTSEHSGFGGLEAACWPLVPKFVGSHPAEAVGPMS